VSVGTLRTVDWVMPQVLQGMRTEVTVLESSMLRLSSRGS